MSDSYEESAWKDGYRYYGQAPNAPGRWVTDTDGGPVFEVEVPGWHLFSEYDRWFRRGFSMAKAGRPMQIGAVPRPSLFALIGVQPKLPQAASVSNYVASMDEAFYAMKDAADTAGWPEDSKAEVIAIDKTWMDLRTHKDMPKEAVFGLIARAKAVTDRLRQNVVAKASASVTPPASTTPPPAEEGFFTRKVIGPVPGWGVVVGGAGALGVVGFLIRKAL